MKNFVLLSSSLLFYGWGEPKYLAFMLASIAQSYIAARLVERLRGTAGARLVTALSAAASLGLLAYCKYADFFIENFNALTGLSVPLLRVALPVGISFYTFQILSYVIDVYRGDVPAQRNFIDLAMYVAMFPQLIAGPIVRYSDIAGSLKNRRTSLADASEGITRFSVGLAKKILLANQAALIVSEFKAKEGVDLSSDKMAMQRIKEAAEKAKIDLSGVTKAKISLPFITMANGAPKHLDMDLTRAKFDSLTEDLVEKTMTPTKQALKDAGLSVSDIAKVIMVGGSTRIPAVYEAVKKFIGKDPYKGINPDECVAIGAAIQAGVLAGEVKDMLLLDVTPLSLGIETLGGVFTKLIDRNTTIPTSKSQIFSTAADHQTSVDIHVLQGERKFARDNKTLGRFELTGIAPAPRGVPQIEVTFDIDANGIVSVKAVDKGTNKSQSITITASSNLSESDIEAAIKDAEKYAEEDEKRKNLVEAKNNAEQFIFVIEKFRTDNEEKIADADKTALTDAVKEAREALEKAESDEEVKSIVAKLSKVTDPIFTKFYQENPEAAAEAAKQAGFDPNAANNDGGFAGGDGVVNDGDNMTPPEGGWED